MAFADPLPGTPCPPGQTPNRQGNCVGAAQPSCPPGQTRGRDGGCVPLRTTACPRGEVRNANGVASRAAARADCHRCESLRSGLRSGSYRRVSSGRRRFDHRRFDHRSAAGCGGGRGGSLAGDAYAVLAFLLHIGAQHGVHAPLIAGTIFFEIVQHILVDSDRDRFLFRRDDQDGLGPVEIQWNRVRIVPNGLLDLFICQRIDRGPISLPPPGIARQTRVIFSPFVSACPPRRDEPADLSTEREGDRDFAAVDIPKT